MADPSQPLSGTGALRVGAMAREGRVTRDASWRWPLWGHIICACNLLDLTDLFSKKTLNIKPCMQMVTLNLRKCLNSRREAREIYKEWGVFNETFNNLINLFILQCWVSNPRPCTCMLGKNSTTLALTILLFEKSKKGTMSRLDQAKWQIPRFLFYNFLLSYKLNVSSKKVDKLVRSSIRHGDGWIMAPKDVKVLISKLVNMLLYIASGILWMD
jgi:hypothetical protein